MWRNGGPGSKIPERTKRTIRRRQQGQCAVYDPTICNGTIAEYDHTVNLKSMGLARDAVLANDPSLIQGLCTPCHRKKSSDEGHAAKRARTHRPSQPNPGLAKERS